MNADILLQWIFAILPGYFWLVFFLNKDKNPEPNLSIIRIFLLGFIAAIPAYCIEVRSMQMLESFSISPLLSTFIKYFIIVAVFEEIFKYLAAKSIIKRPVFDEPVDMMIYMIVAALGFATAENVIIFSMQNIQFIQDSLFLMFIRFIGATFLHALCSGVLGYFLAISFNKNNKKYVGLGFALAICAHGFFDFFMNYSIIESGQYLILTPAFIIPCGIIIILAVLVNFYFKRLKNLKSTCKI